MKLLLVNGYRVHDETYNRVCITHEKRTYATAVQKKTLKRQNVIELIIRHTKSDGQ